MSRIGILALQGAFLEHGQALDKLNIPHFEIRQRADLERSMDGLILPGGESTVMGKLLRELKLFDSLQERIREGLPVFGTCAGLILLAKSLEKGEAPHLATMDISARRNAYGRQLGSFHATGDFGGLTEIPMVFIRAPLITGVSHDTRVLSRTKGEITAAREKNQLVTSFHPELTGDLRVHQYFIEEMVEQPKFT